MVQEEMARRSEQNACFGKRKSFSANHPFSKIVFCAECGEEFRRIHWNNRGKKSIVWRCLTRLERKDECHARTINEEILIEAFLDALNEIVGNSDEYLTRLKNNLETAINEANPESAPALASKMAKLQQELIDRTERHELQQGFIEAINRMIEDSEYYIQRLKGNMKVAIISRNPLQAESLAERMRELQQELIDRTESGTNYDDLSEEILRLRELQEQTNMDEAAKNERKKRIRELANFIDSQPRNITEFDEALAKKLLEGVRVGETYLEFQFKSGARIVIENE